MSLVDKILRKVAQLPPFPVVVQRALQLVANPTSSAQDVVDVIQFDQSITADVLRLCNSAYFSLQRKVNSLREALVLIGFNQLFEIILSRQSSHLFSGPSTGYDLQRGELWRHSVASSLLSGIITKRLGRQPSPVLFTAALLHDIGKVVLSEFVKDYFEEIKKLVQEKSVSFSDAEKEILGIDHAELGGRITEEWKFPKVIVSSVRYHHAPFSTSDPDETVRLTHLCDVVAMLSGIGGGSDGLFYHSPEEILNHYRLNEEDIERFMIQLEDQFGQVKELLNVT
jgi:putative nucleotidyltransferase with HDIG domain